VIGLLGGIGSGKSYIANRLRELGPGRVVDADTLAHRALDNCARDGRVAEDLGPQYVNEDGTANRAALAEDVFENPALLRSLERMVHPQVLVWIQEAIQKHRGREGPPLLILDIPLLIEVGLDRRCDALWYIEVPEALRLERAGRRGLTPADIRRRELSQSPLSRKRKRAHLIIDNDVDEADLERQIREGLETLGVRVQSPSPETSGP
jgi:dephospho-CoA kinase